MAKTEITQYGFNFGPAVIERLCSDDSKGWVYLAVNTPKETQGINVYVTKTGKLRVYRNGKEIL